MDMKIRVLKVSKETGISSIHKELFTLRAN